MHLQCKMWETHVRGRLRSRSLRLRSRFLLLKQMIKVLKSMPERMMLVEIKKRCIWLTVS